MTSAQNITPDLKNAAINAAESIQAAMASLYNLETSLINANGSRSSPALRGLFMDIRKPLKEEWEMLLAFLQKCVAFGGDVTTLKESLGVESVADCVEFLIDMAKDAIALSKESTSIQKRSQAAGKAFAQQVPRLESFLQAARRAELEREEMLRIEAASTQGYAMPNLESFTWTDRPIVAEPTRAERATRSFVEANLAAIRPDGLEALSATQDALQSISSALSIMAVFWESTSSICQTFILKTSSGEPNVTPKQAKLFADVWKGNQEGLKHAITSIAKSCDAILVEAVGAPPRFPTPPPTAPTHPNHLQRSRPHQSHLGYGNPSSQDSSYHNNVNPSGWGFSINYYQPSGGR